MRRVLRRIFVRSPNRMRRRLISICERLGSSLVDAPTALFLQLSRLGRIDLVVHIGAHRGQEVDIYKALGVCEIVWVEADPVLVLDLKHRLCQETQIRHHVIEGAASASSGNRVMLKRFNNDGASSSLHPSTQILRDYWPGLSETGEEVEVDTLSLSDILVRAAVSPNRFRCPLLVLDVQGHELQVLRGATAGLLSGFRAIQCELSAVELYEGGGTMREIVALLEDAGFRAITKLPSVHGDVLFVHCSH